MMLLKVQSGGKIDFVGLTAWRLHSVYKWYHIHMEVETVELEEETCLEETSNDNNILNHTSQIFCPRVISSVPTTCRKSSRHCHQPLKIVIILFVFYTSFPVRTPLYVQPCIIETANLQQISSTSNANAIQVFQPHTPIPIFTSNNYTRSFSLRSFTSSTFTFFLPSLLSIVPHFYLRHSPLYQRP